MNNLTTIPWDHHGVPLFPHIFYVFGVKHDGRTDGIEMSGATHPVLISHNLSFTEFINLSQQSAFTAIKQTDRSPAGQRADIIRAMILIKCLVYQNFPLSVRLSPCLLVESCCASFCLFLGNILPIIKSDIIYVIPATTSPRSPLH